MKSNKAVVKMMKPQTGDQSIAPLVEELLGRLGEDPKRDGLAHTPQRVDKALRFLTSGYQMKIGQILNGALYEVKYDEMVVVRDIEFFSLCEHHMLRSEEPRLNSSHLGISYAVFCLKKKKITAHT